MSSRFNSKAWILPLAILLGLNSAYLALRNDPNPFYFGNVALHLGLGLVLMASLGPRVVRRAFRTLEPPEKLAALLLGAAAGLGLVLMVTGTTRPYRPLLWVHIALAAAGALLLVARAAAGALRRVAAEGCPRARARDPGARGRGAHAGLPLPR